MRTFGPGATDDLPEAVEADYPASDRDALLRPARLRGIELPLALFDAASPLVSGNRGADISNQSRFH